MNKIAKVKNYICSRVTFRDMILSAMKHSSVKKPHPKTPPSRRCFFWNRSPGARYPKKANNGARPDCRSVRKIRKRLKTGK